jgi:hypothetical protein
MRESRRNIENIARLHLFIDNGFKRIDLQQVRMRAVLFHRHFFAHAPAATAGTLNDKHIILIEMRTDAPPGTEKEIIRSSMRQSGRARNGCISAAVGSCQWLTACTSSDQLFSLR